ncbi:putative transport protein transmembrane [Citreicella sp. 357]|nr:putative transport protein transmembrane [Citreicella sp. 357]
MTREDADASSAPAPKAPPPFVAMPWQRAAAYMGASALLALTQGLGQGFVSSNLPQIGGEIGATTNQSIWLTAAYMAPRASLPLLLIKIRTQYGLRRFAEIGIVFYVLVALLSLMVTDLHSAITVQFVAGCASAPLSTLAFLYMLEPLSPQKKMSVGLSAALTLIMLGPSLSRVVSPLLMADAGWTPLHVMGLGMALVCLSMVFLLPLSPQPRARVISALDIVSYALIAIAFGGVTVTFLMGSQLYWTETGWLGELMVVSLAAGVVAVAIELNRKAPLLDIRWLASPAILHLTGALLLFRMILSEQTSGAPGLFRTLGLGPSQISPLFVVIVVASILGGICCARFLAAGREPTLHMVALFLIAIGAYMDSHSTILTRPEQMYASQAMIAFAGALFLPPALLSGLMSALAKGPNYILSFVIVFLSTQSIGGVIGSGLFNTFVSHRQALHMQVLGEQLSRTDPLVAQNLGAGSSAYAATISDNGLRLSQAVSDIAGTVSTQAYVMAYNDAFLLLSMLASVALMLLITHIGLARWHAARNTAAVAT